MNSTHGVCDGLHEDLAFALGAKCTLLDAGGVGTLLAARLLGRFFAIGPDVRDGDRWERPLLDVRRGATLRDPLVLLDLLEFLDDREDWRLLLLLLLPFDFLESLELLLDLLLEFLRLELAGMALELALALCCCKS